MKILALFAILALSGCSHPTPKWHTEIHYVDNCFLGEWTFIDNGLVTAKRLDGSPFNCQEFNGRRLEITYRDKSYLSASDAEGDYVHARILDSDKKGASK